MIAFLLAAAVDVAFLTVVYLCIVPGLLREEQGNGEQYSRPPDRGTPSL